MEKKSLEERLDAIKALDHLRVANLNERVAASSTVWFGSMWTTYLFFLYGFLPLFPALKPYQGQFLYWGSWIQLWALPLLMVGGIVLNRATERRAAEDHETLMLELDEIKALKDDMDALKQSLDEIKQVILRVESHLSKQ